MPLVQRSIVRFLIQQSFCGSFAALLCWRAKNQMSDQYQRAPALRSHSNGGKRMGLEIQLPTASLYIGARSPQLLFMKQIKQQGQSKLAVLLCSTV